MSQQQHTQEPWHVATGDDYYIEANGIPAKYPHHFKGDDLGKHVAIVGNRTSDFGEANARRIVACVNACAGIPTDMLERFKAIVGAMDEVSKIEKQRDVLVQFVEEVRRSGDTRLASMAIAALASVKGGAA